MLAETRARGPDGLAATLARRSRATSSVDGWASMALRSDVVEAAGVTAVCTGIMRRLWVWGWLG